MDNDIITIPINIIKDYYSVEGHTKLLEPTIIEIDRKEIRKILNDMIKTGEIVFNDR